MNVDKNDVADMIRDFYWNAKPEPSIAEMSILFDVDETMIAGCIRKLKVD